ncbi:MAG: HAD-IA family hydrolase, partial [Alphaproteobacteria bacterium]
VQGGALTARPGVRRLIAEARAAGLRLGLATSSQRLSVENMVPVVLGPGALSWFDAIGCGDDVARKKPQPDVYLHVLDRLGLTADECVAIEDTELGLAAAVAAGIPTVVTVASYSGGDDFTGATVVLSCLGDPGEPMVVLAGGGRDSECPSGAVADVARLREWQRVGLRRET